MSSTDKDLYTEALKQRAEQLEKRLAKIKQDVTKTYSTDLDEQALERENDEVLDELGNTVQQELNLIHRALQRHEKGEYGICIGCHHQIDTARLEAIPEAEHCINCASKI